MVRNTTVAAASIDDDLSRPDGSVMSTTTYVGTNAPTRSTWPSGNQAITSGGGVDDIVLGALSGGLGSIVVTEFPGGL